MRKGVSSAFSRGCALALGLGLATGALAFADAARADACERCGPQHRVRFQVESTRDVENDWITAVVGVTAEDANPAALADRINQDMAWALEQARAEPKVKAKSGGYSTYPIHDDAGRIRRWRASQQLVLEGSDSAAMTALVGRLQARLQLQSFDFSVSEERRRKVQEELVTEALAAFRARAALVAKGLGASSFALDDVSVETGPQWEPTRMRAEMAMDSSFKAAPPAVEAGTSRVAVSVQGSIVLD